MQNHKIYAFDNGGKTWDRYTIIIDDQVFGMSDNANSPSGFNQWNGELSDFTAINDALAGHTDKNIGKAISTPDLPLEVRLAIGSRLATDEQPTRMTNVSA